jgi:hypothetical protein
MTDARGCAAQDSIRLSIDPDAALGDTLALCPGKTLTLNAGNPGATYAWSTGDSTQFLVVSQTGTYAVEVSRGTCIDADTVVVVAGDGLPTNQVQVIGNLQFCAGGQVALDAGSAPADTRYLWSTGSTQRVLLAQTTGNYTVAITNSCGTVVRGPFAVVANPVPVQPRVSVRANELEVLNPDGSALQWFRNNQPVSGATNLLFAPTQSGTYLVRATSPAGCSSESLPVTLTITDRQQPDTWAQHLRVYPNPAASELYIGGLPLGLATALEATLTALDGRTLLVTDLQPSAAGVVRIACDTLPAGLYLLQLRNGNSHFMQRVVIQGE